MKWRKAPEALVQTFKDAVPEAPRVERRTMFGYPCAFIAGNMFGGIYQDTVVVRLSEARRTAAIQRDGARPFEPMPGRPMREYVVVPSAAAEDTATLRRWLAEALDYAATLPPKAKGKPRKAG